jgi:iron complex outermembrane receptor protein
MRNAVFAALVLSTAIVAVPATAQVAAPPPADEVPAGEEILVVGTRAQGRTVAESPVPVDVINVHLKRCEGGRATMTYGKYVSSMAAI